MLIWKENKDVNKVVHLLVDLARRACEALTKPIQIFRKVWPTPGWPLCKESSRRRSQEAREGLFRYTSPLLEENNSSFTMKNVCAHCKHFPR